MVGTVHRGHLVPACSSAAARVPCEDYIPLQSDSSDEDSDVPEDQEDQNKPATISLAREPGPDENTRSRSEEGGRSGTWNPPASGTLETQAELTNPPPTVYTALLCCHQTHAYRCCHISSTYWLDVLPLHVSDLSAALLAYFIIAILTASSRNRKLTYDLQENVHWWSQLGDNRSYVSLGGPVRDLQTLQGTIANLAPRKPESLRDYFSQFGEVVECTVMRDGATGRSRGFGFLTFKDPKTVNIVMVKEHFLDGKIVSHSDSLFRPAASAGSAEVLSIQCGDQESHFRRTDNILTRFRSIRSALSLATSRNAPPRSLLAASAKRPRTRNSAITLPSSDASLTQLS